MLRKMGADIAVAVTGPDVAPHRLFDDGLPSGQRSDSTAQIMVTLNSAVTDFRSCSNRTDVSKLLIRKNLEGFH
jgi:hypothetical protein